MIWQEWSRFVRFGWEIWIPHKILHPYSAPGFHQTIPGAKVMFICMRFGPFLHFLSPEITYRMGSLWSHLTSWWNVRLTWFFFKNHIKNTSPILWAQLFDPWAPTSHRTSIEQVLWRKKCRFPGISVLTLSQTVSSRGPLASIGLSRWPARILWYLMSFEDSREVKKVGRVSKNCCRLFGNAQKRYNMHTKSRRYVGSVS